MKRIITLLIATLLLLLSIQNLKAQELQNITGTKFNQKIVAISANSNQTTTKSPLNGSVTTKSMYTLSSTFTSPPILSGTTIIAPGDSAILTFNVGNTTGPFTLKYVTSGGDTVVKNGLNNGNTFKVSPTVTTSYMIVSVTDINDSVSDGNLVVNPSGDAGLTIWTFTSGGGGWTTETNSLGYNFATSYVSENKSQTIDLVANGYSTTELDAQPNIYVSDDYSTRFDQGGNYGVLTQLRNTSNTSITSWSNPTAYTTPGSPSFNTIASGTNWTTTSKTYSSYGTGVRSVYFEDAGHDISSWAGFYGPKMRNSTVKLAPVVKVVGPCVAPANQPTNFSLNNTGATITGSFTASAGTPTADHYLIVRSSANALTASPVNGTTYTAGTTYGGGTVVAFQAGTSFTDNGPFTLASKYYYFVFAANANCSNGPIYKSTIPLKDSITILSHDVYVSKIISPADTVTLSSTQTVSVRVKNNGMSTETSFLIGYQRNALTPVLENWTGSLFPGDSMTYNFLSTFVASPATAFTICAYTKLTTDQDTTNNKLCKTVHFPSGIGINEKNILSDNINIYPNPAHDKLTINCSNIKRGITKFSIFNVQGAKIYSDETIINTNAFNKVINVSNLKSGIYYLKFENDSGVINNKFIVE
ncbi:MAG: T9SS type A sorting domain-containing protein [Bacteroidota bacterium]